MIVSVHVDIKDTLRDLNAIQRKQVPFAASVALNRTAFDMQRDGSDAMSVFDRPRGQTLKGLYVLKSKKTDLTAIVGVKSRKTGRIPVSEYLQANIDGGGRVDKRSEILLKNAGVLPKDMQARPGPDARLDRYGNMSRGQIVQILSYFKAFGSIKTSGRGFDGDTKSQKLNRGKRATARSMFVLPSGVYERRGRQVQYILTFTRPELYPRSYDFETIARASAARHFRGNFDKALRNALVTAR